MARNCDLALQCKNNACEFHNRPYNSYSDEIVKGVLIQGLADMDIRLQVMGVTGLDDKTLEETVTIVEEKEMAMRAVSGTPGNTSGSAVKTDYKGGQVSDPRLQLKGPCEKCKAI